MDLRAIRPALLTGLTRPAACACLLLATQSQVGAQSTEAFDSLSISLRAAGVVNRNTFHDYWSSNPSAELEFETPFYLGRIQFGLHYASFDAKSEAQPDFASLFPYLGWGYAWQVSRDLAWYNGLRIGSFIQRFDIDDGNATEQELGLAVNSRLGYALSKSWSIDLSARYRVVFTHERLRWLFLAVGVSHSMRTPDWLRGFFD